jgi:acyl-CoA synthetase (NDP forming)
MGVCCPEVGLNTIVPPVIAAEGPVAFIGQSGWASQNFIGMGDKRGLRFSKVVSVGNQADMAIEDFLEYFGGDDKTRSSAAIQ